jgi:SRSO17 transposase
MAAVAGLKPKHLARVRGRLEVFAEEMFESMARSDQRRWGGVYLRGLMLDGHRKSIEPMAARLEDGDEQCLQQFVNQSPWASEPVRQRLAQRMLAEIEPAAWVIDDTGFPKFGRMSVGVARQYCGALGKVGNCQIGVSVHAVSDEASCPLDWRLFLPQEWDQDAERRARAHVPEEVSHRPKWQLVLDMLDELAEWGFTPPVLCADGAYGDSSEFRLGLAERDIEYVLDAKAKTSALPECALPERAEYEGKGRPQAPRYRGPFSSLRELALGAGAHSAEEVCWRQGSRGAMSSRFIALRIRPANVKLRRSATAKNEELPVCWLLAEWPEGESEPVKYWISNLPEGTPIQHLVHLAKLRWRIEHDYRELKDALGLDHFEGRSWRGWHHHVTLVSVAHAFLTLERQRPRLRAAA